MYFIFLPLLFTGCLNHRDKIGIQPFGNISSAYLDTVQYTLHRFYHCDVVLLPAIELPKTAFVHLKSPRYRADSLIHFLNYIKNDAISRIIGITDWDISTSKKDKHGRVLKPENRYMDWGILGLGQTPGTSCVISTFRIKHPSEDLFLQRLTKVAVHEVGHTFGLSHCKDTNCTMQDAAEKISSVDRCPLRFCPNCYSKIKTRTYE